MDLGQLCGDVKTVHAWHHDVCDEQIDPLCMSSRDVNSARTVLGDQRIRRIRSLSIGSSSTIKTVQRSVMSAGVHEGTSCSIDFTPKQ